MEKVWPTAFSQVIESPLWALVRDFLTSEDVLHMRTTGIKWNIARLYCSFAELFFLLASLRRWKWIHPSLVLNGQVCDMTTDNSMNSTTGFLNLGSYPTANCPRRLRREDRSSEKLGGLCRVTLGRVAGAHEDVLNLHTEA